VGTFLIENGKWKIENGLLLTINELIGVRGLSLK
jgi:hypothetical protein